MKTSSTLPENLLELIRALLVVCTSGISWFIWASLQQRGPQGFTGQCQTWTEMKLGASKDPTMYSVIIPSILPYPVTLCQLQQCVQGLCNLDTPCPLAALSHTHEAKSNGIVRELEETLDGCPQTLVWET